MSSWSKEDQNWHRFTKEVAEPDWQRKKRVHVLSFVLVQIAIFSPYYMCQSIKYSVVFFLLLPFVVSGILLATGQFKDKRIHHDSGDGLNCELGTQATFMFLSWIASMTVMSILASL